MTEAIVSWLADARMDEADHEAIEAARSEAAERGGAEFEASFDGYNRIKAD